MGSTDREVGLNFRAIYLWLQGGLHFQNRQDQIESKSQTLNNNAEVDRSRILGPSHFTQICWTSFYLCHAEGTSPTTNHTLRPGFLLHLLWLVSVFLLQEFELKSKTWRTTQLVIFLLTWISQWESHHLYCMITLLRLDVHIESHHIIQRGH